MTTRAALLQLRDRLAAATGPDRELDQDIALATGWTLSTTSPMVWWLPPANGEWVMGPRAFTGSIDAAVTLVPDGWEWVTSNRARPPHTGRAYINNRELIYSGTSSTVLNPKHKFAECTAATPALALCLACIEYKLARTATP